MSTLTNGTTVAATTAEQAMLGQVLGFPVNYGRAVILGSVPLPDEAMQAALDAGLDPSRFEAYVIEPRTADGGNVTTADVDPGLDPNDLAYVAVWDSEAGEKPQSPIGPIDAVILAQKVSKSEFLATVETRNDAIVDQFRAELEDDLFLLAADADDDAPDFLD